jgi:hypothetical protein
VSEKTTESRAGEIKPIRLARYAALLGVWAIVVLGGFNALLRYEGAAAPVRPAPLADVSLALAGKPSLILALHPKCPCSAASVAELEKIYSHAPDKFSITVLAYKPAGEADSWVETTSIAAVRKLNPRVVIDRDGTAARRLGMTTSGQVIIYDAAGQLVFNGGITSARGHRGDNLGEQEALDVIRGGAPSQTCSPVFGCSLFEGTL